jgi:hypothetical protein
MVRAGIAVIENVRAVDVGRAGQRQQQDANKSKKSLHQQLYFL